MKFEAKGKVETVSLDSRGGTLNLKGGQKMYIAREFRLQQKIRKGDVIKFSYLKKSKCIIELLSVEW